MADAEENVRTLMELTAMNYDEAKAYLVSKSSLQEAIDSFFNSTNAADNEDVIHIPDDTTAPAQDELDPSHPDYVRPPIAPKRDILMLPEEDNFRRRNFRQALCPLRNFAREAELQEELIFGGGEGTSSRPKRSRLEDVFRPPTDLIFVGTFQMVKDFAKTENKWLMINLQDNTEFACQVLNRDIWSNREIKGIIKKYFIFYQTTVDCIEGNKVMSFYKVQSYPYIGILDPRTGEEQMAFKGLLQLTADQFAKELFTFLHNNFTPDYIDTGKTPTKFQQDSQGGPSSSQTGESSGLNQIISLTEEEQLEIAIKKSMEEAAVATVVSDSEDDYEEPISDEEGNAGKAETPKKSRDNGCTEDLEADNNVDDGPQTKLMIRLPNGQNEVIQRGASTTIGALVKFLQKKYRNHIETPTCRVYCPAVRKELSDMDKLLTLEAAKLHPSAVLHISSDD